ncbi:hypothetical protein [uncultured Selenomonas sp.]|uniref:hypothetical protein n=1 Tax=uncultured Selenomonas sp. TaxID=159275 RepID=UPI0025E822CE|nr:hypothetical protein [uncultured Selenomonas sp.]
MSNSIFEDALLLAAGGIVGLIAGAALMSDDEEDDDEEEARVAPKAAGRSIEDLVASLKNEAQQALVNCETDEEREEVSASIRKSIEGLQAVLAKRTAAKATETEAEASDRFVELGKDGQPQPDESFAPKPAQRFQDLAAKLEQALDETLADLPPVTSRPSAPATCGDS